MNPELVRNVSICLSIDSEELLKNPTVPLSRFHSSLITKTNEKHWSSFNLFTHLFTKLIKIDIKKTGIAPYAVARDYYSFIVKTLRFEWLNTDLKNALSDIQKSAVSRKGTSRNGCRIALKIRETGFFIKNRGIRAAFQCAVKFHRLELSEIDSVFEPDSKNNSNILVTDLKLKFGDLLITENTIQECILDLNNCWKNIKDLEDIRGKTDVELCSTIDTFEHIKKKLGQLTYNFIKMQYYPNPKEDLQSSDDDSSELEDDEGQNERDRSKRSKETHRSREGHSEPTQAVESTQVCLQAIGQESTQVAEPTQERLERTQEVDRTTSIQRFSPRLQRSSSQVSESHKSTRPKLQRTRSVPVEERISDVHMSVTESSIKRKPKVRKDKDGIASPRSASDCSETSSRHSRTRKHN